MILKTSKQVYDVMFSDIKKYVYSESVFSALYIKIKHKYPKKTSLGQTKGDKKYALISFASSKSSQFYFAIFIWFVTPKLRAGFFIFDSVLLLLNFMFLFNKMHLLCNFKTL